MRNGVLCALLFFPLLVGAVEDKDVATCAAMENSVSRLACFDRLAEKYRLAPSTTKTETEGAGEWEVSKEVDPLTDKEVHFAVLPAQTGKGKYGDRIILVVRCENNRTVMYVDWANYLGSGSLRTTYRVGKNPAQTSQWGLSTDKKAAFFPSSPIPLLKQIEESDSFVANVTPYNESPVTATFDTRGADAAFKGIRSACGW